MLFVTQLPADLINDLGARQWSTRERATSQLHEMMQSDTDVFRQVVESLHNNSELTLESKLRHQVLIERYIQLASHMYTDFSVGPINATLPDAFIWSLPREHRYVDGVDVAAELYRRAIDDLARNGFLFDREILNAEIPMRFATHLFMVDWLYSYRTHEDLNEVFEAMQAAQADDIARLREHLESVGFSGKIELRSVPPAIEDRTGENGVSKSSQSFYFRRPDGGSL